MPRRKPDRHADPLFPIVSRFARLLGWKDLESNTHTYSRKAKSGETIVRVVRWFDYTSADDLRLQINETPCLSAAVYAIRFKICSGYYPILLDDEWANVNDEAERLRSRLHRSCFTTQRARREFRKQWPQCTGFTWTRLREQGAPFKVSSY